MSEVFPLTPEDKLKAMERLIRATAQDWAENHGSRDFLFGWYDAEFTGWGSNGFFTSGEIRSMKLINKLMFILDPVSHPKVQGPQMSPNHIYDTSK